MLNACLADIRGRTSLENIDDPQAEFLQSLADKLVNADLSDIKQRGLKGKAFGEAIRQHRLGIIKSQKNLLPKTV